MSPLVDDGRRQRRITSHARIITACRELMSEGAFRPIGQRIACRAGVSQRCVFLHFDSVDDVYREALKDPAVRARLINHIFGPTLIVMSDAQLHRVIAAVVFGERYHPISYLAAPPPEQAAAA